MTRKLKTCCLCGQPESEDDPITREHVPPKQFYPKSMRSGLNLWATRAHKSCNNATKNDEEYFVFAMLHLVIHHNPTMATVLLEDLIRRMKGKHLRGVFKSVLAGVSPTTSGGLALKPGDFEVSVDAHRVNRVVVKIARCLFSRDYDCFLPDGNCLHVQLCPSEVDVPEIFRLSWGLENAVENLAEAPLAKSKGGVLLVDLKRVEPSYEHREVFSYRRAELDGTHYYTLHFWGAFFFCLAFTDPRHPTTGGLQPRSSTGWLKSGCGSLNEFARPQPIE